MRDTRIWCVAAVLLSGCGVDGDDDDGAGDTTEGSATQSTTVTTSATTTMSTSATTTDDASTGGSDDTTGHHDDESTSHGDETLGHESGTTGEPTVCDIIGEGCHDNETPEGIDCHLLGHDGDLAACEEAFDMCAKICGL